MTRRTVGVGTDVVLRVMQADTCSLSRCIWRRANSHRISNRQY
jgi:hypothetical protein